MLQNAMTRAGKLRRLFFFSPRQLAYLWRLRRSGLFDRQFYRGTNPALHPVARAFPERHYIAFGEGMRLRPNPDFAPDAYIRHNPDLGPMADRPFLHYIRFGRHEGRLTKDLPVTHTGREIDVPVIRPKARRAAFAVVVHLYYHDLWPEIAETLRAVDVEFDLFVGVVYFDEETDALCAKIAEEFPGARVYAMPNRGRDIFPFVHLVNSGCLDGYRAVCKLHTKKSPHRQDGDHWRRHLIGGVLPGKGTRALVERFLADRAAAFWVADGQFYQSTEWWGSNEAAVRRLLLRVETRMDRDALAFPAGSIYWLKPAMLAMIRGMQLGVGHFEPELGQVDGTLAHAFERALGYLAAAGGLTVRQTSELEAAAPPAPLPRPALTSAFYLPQFHPTPENDAWWGKGFTEWTSVTRARPAFSGHVQPFLPADLGFYDLRLPETMGAQWQMAKAAGIGAFCVYHYWFGGTRVLEAPLDNLMARPEIAFPFYLCWANESWRRNWDGLSGEVLLAQDYAEGFERALAEDVLPYMRDARYLRPDGTRPRFVIYRPEDLPDPAANLARLRAAWRELGVGEVELGAVLFHVAGENPVADDLFDFWIEMPPHGLVAGGDYLVGGPDGNRLGVETASDFRGLVYDYAAVARRGASKARARALPANTIAGVMPSWDNTARRGAKAHLAYGATPLAFGQWLDGIMAHRIEGSYRRELFVNAWNEWAEKAVLEPSAQYGRAVLDALKERI